MYFCCHCTVIFFFTRNLCKTLLQKASWKDVIQLYEVDVGDYDTKILKNLSDLHVYPNKIKKMKVKFAAQVFSRTVSAVMRAFTNHGKIFINFCK